MVERNIPGPVSPSAIMLHLESYEVGATCTECSVRHEQDAPLWTVTMSFDGQPDDDVLDEALSELP